LNVWTAALGAVDAGFASLSKWHAYAATATFNEEAMSFYTPGVSNIQPVLTQNQLLPQPAPILMRACNAADIIDGNP